MRELLPVFDRQDTAHIQFLADCISATTGDVLEIGADATATPLLGEFTRARGRTFLSRDTDPAHVPNSELPATRVGCVILRAGSLADKASLLARRALWYDLAVVIGTDTRAVAASPTWSIISRAHKHAAAFVGAAPWVTALSNNLKLTSLAALKYDTMLARFHALELR